MDWNLAKSGGSGFFDKVSNGEWWCRRVYEDKELCSGCRIGVVICLCELC